MRRELTLLAALLALPAQAEPLFQPVAIPDHVYSGGWEHFVAGGLAVFGVMRRDEYAAHAFAVLRYRAADFFG